MPRPFTSLENRFWSKIFPEPNSGCWLWTDKPSFDGYGVINSGGQNGLPLRAHVLSYIIHFGPVPKRKIILHHCDNRPCVSPQHIYAGTYSQNVQDMLRRNRDNYALGGRNGNAIISADIAADIIVRLNRGGTISFIARKLNISYEIVRSIKRGRSWKYLN